MSSQDPCKTLYSPCNQISNWSKAFEALVEQKNGWQLAEYVGDSTPYGIQNLLGRARWDIDAVWDDLQQYVEECLADPEGTVVVNETGFLKKGRQSAGVQ